MAEPESTEGQKGKKSKPGKGVGGLEGSRPLSDRVERSLKDADRLMKKAPQAAPEQKAMAQLEQAKIAALLELADAIRASKKG